MTHTTLYLLIAVTLALAAALLRASVNLRTLSANLHTLQEAQSTGDSQRAHLDTIKNDFVTNVSHELRTPLTSIRGALGLLSSGVLGPTNPRADNLLHIALSNTDRLIRLINDLLDLDRISSGQAPLQLRRCSMRELAQQAIEAMTPQADAARVRLHLLLHAPPDSLFFNAEPDRILQVLTNLLSNAIKFSPPCSIVEVCIEADAETLRLRVSDTGRGIPPEKLASIFGRFEQVDPADAREKGGTGLGLAICRTIMQQHSGAIWAESNTENGRGSGASFFITFPRTARQRDALSPSTPPAKGAILICDSDAHLRSLVAATILRHDYAVLEAVNPDHALELADAHPVQAVLLSLDLPGREGASLIDWLRLQPATSNLPLIVYSAPPGAAEAPSVPVPSSGVESIHSEIPKVLPQQVEDLVLNILRRLESPKDELAA